MPRDPGYADIIPRPAISLRDMYAHIINDCSQRVQQAVASLGGPVAAFSDFQGADSFSSITQQLGEMAQQGMGMAARGARTSRQSYSLAPAAAPVIKSSVMGFGRSQDAQLPRSRWGSKASMPVLGQAAEETLPVLERRWRKLRRC